ncbi:APC family permease [Chloroflexus sp. MS-CIW-1]|jgi:amino acid transporter|uniref:APC family permease n=1 Tax=Chloroflexus sp. MS-CIW-1 TaxID=3055768 RepID=UPI002648F601|nr:APC family permease [Chloroflexus sp. MS-CIW-1]MDN5273876.1 APC family permease [Chloroflexus sp. MS-CIW-1]
MFAQIKRILVGRPIATEHQHQERLNKATALAVFSSDALSSVSYATEAILTILVLGGSTALGLSLPIAAAIAGLLIIVGFSYRQTIHAYPQGGGGYIVTRDNLGDLPGLVAAGALLIDYVLTVAVSISAGVAAITSLATNWGFPTLRDHAVEIALVCILIVTIANLRGAKESGLIFSVPTYAFISGILMMIGVGIVNDLLYGAEPVQHSIDPDIPLTSEMVSLWLILRAFAAGCTALTGIEAISDGVQAFKPPESRNAAITLTWMISLLVTMFLGITWLAYAHQAVPNEFTHETIVSQIARTIFGVGPMYVFIQIATALILVLAANTAFADFPRLASFLSRDRFLPRQFSSRGDRLVFSNGILMLGFCSAILVMIFRANEIAMLPLYAVGVFTSFTLSQSGMIRRHFRYKQPGWHYSVLINGIGATLTGIVLIILIVTKFTHGAWIVITAIPLLVLMFRAINQHYRRVAEQLSLSGAILPPELRRHTAIVLVSGIHRGVLPALQYARSIAPDNVTAVYVDLDPEATEKLRTRWHQWGCEIPLVVLESPYRSLINPILRYLEEVETRYGDDVITVILPEFVPARWWEHLLHNQTGLLIKTALRLRGTVVTSVPYRLER